MVTIKDVLHEKSSPCIWELLKSLPLHQNSEIEVRVEVRVEVFIL